MRARAYPGEEAATLKTPDVVAASIATLAIDGFETLHRLRVN